jgi:putative transposase
MKNTKSPGTYSQIYIHYVFAVKGRECLLHKSWRDEVFKIISNIIKEQGQKPIIVNGHDDHVHVFVGIRPTMRISDLIRDVKNQSSNFINTKRLIRGNFSWQKGYGAFSCSHSQMNRVYQYILNQEEHHRKKSFQDEYRDFLKKHEIEFNPEFVFDFYD